MPGTRSLRARSFRLAVCGLIAACTATIVASQLLAQSGTRQGGSGTQRGGTTVPRSGAPQPTFEQRFWDYLQSSKYQNWAPLPEASADFYQGEGPHGAFLKLYANRTAAGASKQLPHGSVIVKENYGPDQKTLMGLTVMYRSPDYDAATNDWYWVKYEPNGQVSEMSGMRVAGKVNMCIECHSGAGGDDFVFAND